MSVSEHGWVGGHLVCLSTGQTVVGSLWLLSLTGPSHGRLSPWVLGTLWAGLCSLWTWKPRMGLTPGVLPEALGGAARMRERGFSLSPSFLHEKQSPFARAPRESSACAPPGWLPSSLDNAASAFRAIRYPCKQMERGCLLLFSPQQESKMQIGDV